MITDEMNDLELDTVEECGMFVVSVAGKGVNLLAQGATREEALERVVLQAAMEMKYSLAQQAQPLHADEALIAKLHNSFSLIIVSVAAQVQDGHGADAAMFLARRAAEVVGDLAAKPVVHADEEERVARAVTPNAWLRLDQIPAGEAVPPSLAVDLAASKEIARRAIAALSSRSDDRLRQAMEMACKLLSQMPGFEQQVAEIRTALEAPTEKGSGE